MPAGKQCLVAVAAETLTGIITGRPTESINACAPIEDDNSANEIMDER